MGVKIKNRKGHARTAMHGKALTQKERWSEVVVTHTIPTKPDAVMAERVAPKPRKRRRVEPDTLPILEGVKSWNQLSDRTKGRLESKAVSESRKNKAHIK